jgi:hypothetical protein
MQVSLGRSIVLHFLGRESLFFPDLFLGTVHFRAGYLDMVESRELQMAAGVCDYRDSQGSEIS